MQGLLFQLLQLDADAHDSRSSKVHLVRRVVDDSVVVVVEVMFRLWRVTSSSTHSRRQRPRWQVHQCGRGQLTVTLIVAVSCGLLLLLLLLLLRRVVQVKVLSLRNACIQGGNYRIKREREREQ